MRKRCQPFLLMHRRQPVGEGLGVLQRRTLAEELQPPRAMQLPKLFEEAPPEQPREHAHGQEEPRPAGHPGLAVGCQPASRHDAVHMRVMRQRRAPGVQHQRGADTRTQMPGVGREDLQHLGGHVEQRAVDRGLVLICESATALGSVNTTLKYSTGSRSACRASSQRCGVPWPEWLLRERFSPPLQNSRPHEVRTSDVVSQEGAVNSEQRPHQGASMP